MEIQRCRANKERRMRPARIAAIVVAFAVAAVGFFLLGRALRPTEKVSDYHINDSSNPREFRNSVLGVTVRIPREASWELVWEPGRFRHPTPPEVIKLAEMERILPPDGSDPQWARMDIFVEPLSNTSSAAISQALRKLEFRQHRKGFQVLSEKDCQVGGKTGRVRLEGWSIEKPYRAISFHVEHNRKLLAFIGVTEADAFERFEPVFRGIVETVRLR
jgi:hypothetical protein